MQKIEAGYAEWPAAWERKMEPEISLHGEKKDDTVRAILRMARLYGDEQPDDEGDHQAIHLDPGVGKGFLYYNEYLDRCLEKSVDPVSCSYFMHVWNTHFSKNAKVDVDGSMCRIVLRDASRKKRFHECSRCAALKTSIAMAPKEAVETKRRLREEMRTHYMHEVRVEKQLYYARRSEGKETLRDEHDGSLSLIQVCAAVLLLLCVRLVVFGDHAGRC